MYEQTLRVCRLVARDGGYVKELRPAVTIPPGVQGRFVSRLDGVLWRAVLQGVYDLRTVSCAAPMTATCPLKPCSLHTRKFIAIKWSTLAFPPPAGSPSPASKEVSAFRLFND